MILLFVGDEYVVVLDSVGCWKMGLMCICFVLVFRERFRIGRLDIENLIYEVVGLILLVEEGDVGECF